MRRDHDRRQLALTCNPRRCVGERRDRQGRHFARRIARNREIMGPFANSRLTDIAAIGGAAIVLALNMVLLAQTLGISIPGVPAG